MGFWQRGVALERGVALRDLIGHSGGVYGVALSPDGQYAASASQDKAVKVWSLEDGVNICSFVCDAEANCCAFASDRLIVAGDEGGRVHFLSLELPS